VENEQFQERVLFKLDKLEAEQRKTCVELAEQKKDLHNHLDSIAKKSKSTKEKTQLVITVVSLAIASIAIISNFY